MLHRVPSALLLYLPWLLLPLMLNIRLFPFIAPYEEPRWLLFALMLTVLLFWFASTLWRGRWKWLKPHPVIYALALFLCGMAIGIIYTPNKLEGLLRFTFWFAAIALCCMSAWSTRHHPKHKLIFVWATTLACCAFSLHFWWQYTMEYGKLAYDSVAPGGEIMVFFSPIGHVNFTADVLLVLLPVVAYLLWSFRQKALLLMNGISLITMIMVLLTGSSRGALGGLFLGGIFTLSLTIRHIHGYKIRHQWRFLLGSVIAMLIVAIAYQYLPTQFRQPGRVVDSFTHLFTTPDTPLHYDVTQPPLAAIWWHIQPLIGWQRAAIYASSTAMIADAPWLGHGTGSFPFIFPAYSNHFPQFRDSLSTMSNMADNPHNVFFQLATQNGIPLALLFLLLLLTLWWRIIRAVWQRLDAAMIAASVAVTAALFDSMFNHVFFNPTSLFVFSLYAGIWWVWSQREDATESEPCATHQPQKKHRIAAVVVMIFAAWLTMWSLRWGASEWYVGHTLLNTSVQQKLHDVRQAFSINPYNFRAVAALARYAYQQKEYARSMQLLEYLITLTPYDAGNLNNLASLHMAAGNKERAVMLLERALRVQPNFALAKQNLTQLRHH